MGDDSDVDEKCRIMRPETLRPYVDRFFLLAPWPSTRIGEEYRFRRTNDPPLYDNKALQLKRFVTVSDMSAMRDETYRVRTWYLYKEMYLEAAVLSVWLTQHRVLLIQGGESNGMRRNIAYASFSEDITGKWCQPTGDVLIFPGLYRKIYFLKEALLDLKEAMSALRLLDTEISFDTAIGLSQQQVNDEFLKDSIIPTKLRAPREAPMVLVFKPIFSEKFYDMVFPKSRIIVEILQSSAMVFIKLTDLALNGKEIGAALCFVQNLQHYVSFLYNMLPDDEELKHYYTYTMTQWLVGRTYYEIYTRWNDTTDIERSYNKLKRRLTNVVKYAIPEGGLPRSIFPCELSTQFPRDRTKVLETCYFTYNEISVPRCYKRSAYQKETVKLMQLIALLKDWADGFIFPEKPSVFDTTHLFSIDDIYDEIERLRSLKDVNYDFIAMTNVLASKYSRYHIASRSCVLVNDDSGTSYAIEAEKFCTKYHDRVQDAALKILNENYVDEDSDRRPSSSEDFRSVLIKTAGRSLADEVVYGIDKLNHDPHSDCVAALVNTLRKVVQVWFSPRARIDKKTKRIPSEEDKEFDFVMAMFLFGLASMHLLLLEETDEEQHLENSQYVFALACQYLMRDTVAHRVLSAFVEHALMAECFFLVPSGERMWNRSKLSFAVIRRLVRLLPILYELCIHLGITDGPKDYYQVSIVITKYPLSIELFKEKEFTASASDEKMLDYILRDLNAESGKPFLAQKAEEGFNGPGTIYTYRSVSAQKSSPSVDSSPDEEHPFVPHYFFSPPLQGRDDCHYTQCPLEYYYLRDESEFTPIELFGDEYFGKVFTDYEDAKPEYTNDYNPLLVKMKSLLKRVLDVVIEDMEDITRYYNLDQKEVYIKTTVGGIPNGAETCYIPEHLRSELLVILDNLNQEDCPLLLCITRALYRLDRLLDQGHLRTLLRGRLNLWNRE